MLQQLRLNETYVLMTISILLQKIKCPSWAVQVDCSPIGRIRLSEKLDLIVVILKSMTRKALLTVCLQMEAQY